MVAIADEDVARVRAATDIVALIGEHAALKRQGRRWVGLCPFHQEKTPSFSVNAEEGLYYCFGCQRSGDAITFLREIDHVDFVEAVRRLADRAGITIVEDEAATADHRRRAPLYDALARAVSWYHERLLHGADGGPARQYLRSRGYDGDVVRRFSLGWAPEGWDQLARHLAVPADVLEASGLGFVNRAGRLQDAFRGRLIFPIFDPSGRAIGLGGRVLPGAEAVGPKYKNSADGPLYAKRRVLYGLNWAKYDVIASGEVVVCEGYTDVVGCFVAGVPRAVATCGTALGEEHFRLLSNFARRIVLAYDADSAGLAGAGRVYEWERGHQVDVAVAELPAGSDPGELARSDPAGLMAALASARPFLQFQVEQVLAKADFGHAEGRARAAEDALRAVAEHPSPLVRDQYLMTVADRCRLPADSLRPLLQQLVAAAGAVPGGGTGSRRGSGGRSGEGRPAQGGGQAQGGHRRGGGEADSDPEWGADRRADHAPTVPGSLRAGMEALRLAVHAPEQVADRLQRVLFLDARQRAAFDALVAEDELHRAIERAEQSDPAVARILRRVAVEEPAADADDVIVQMIRNAVRHGLGAVQAEGRTAPERLADLAAETARVRSDLFAVERDPLDHPAAARLVAWLGIRGEEDA